jgi:hypothetical protein
MRVYIFYILVFLIIAFWVWYFAIRIDKKKAIAIIVKNSPTADPKKLEGFGEDYLIARAKAFRSKKETFELNGKSYITATGKAA